jgi:microcystin-dependent protein
MCDGSTYSVNDYEALAAALGTYTDDTGVSFTVPNLTSSAPSGLTPYIVATGTFPSNYPVPVPNYQVVSGQYLGEVVYSSSTYPPSGWAVCDGSVLTIAQNTALYSEYGNTFGGNGQSTFALPTVSGAIIATTGIYPSRN